ncbi:zinc finger HIT domain-containing protein 3-like [Lampetra planeri]
MLDCDWLLLLGGGEERAMEAMKRATLCAVCALSPRKYKCPACESPYCSVECYKVHKGSSNCIPKPNTAAATSTGSPLDRRHDKAVDNNTYDYADEDSDQVPPTRLRLLDESAALRALLDNPHLRSLLTEVDGAQDKATAMRLAMQEPLFVEFADRCLSVVAPAEGERED